MKKGLFVGLGILVMFFPLSAMAESILTNTVMSATQTTSTEAVKTQSGEWGITESQWQRYEKVMAEQKRGVWSPGLDPLTALGVSADSPSERKHFAELFVRAEFERVHQELAFQREVDEAWKRLYPDTPRLSEVVHSKAAVGSAQRYAVVVSTHCAECKTVVTDRLMRLAHSKRGAAVDVHVVGTGGDDAKLRAWVKKNRWLEDALKERRATLNHGDQFAELSKFPVVYAQGEGGQWTREL